MRTAWGLIAILVAGCGGDDGVPEMDARVADVGIGDAGGPIDSGGALDAGSPVDAGPRPEDAGPPAMDAGSAPDAGAAIDAATPLMDAGMAPVDSGPVTMDGGAPPMDACVAVPEVCNGRDDDCDGAADETFACVAGSLVPGCTTACGTAGSQVCDATCALTAECTAVETCNDADDDCDTRVDEGILRHALIGTTSRGERAVIVPNGATEFGLFLIDDARSRAWLPLPASGDPRGRIYAALSGGGELTDFDAKVEPGGPWLFTAVGTSLARGMVIRYPLPSVDSLVDAAISTPDPGIMRIGAVTADTAVAYHTLSNELVRSELGFAGAGSVTASAVLSTTNVAFDLASSAGGDYLLQTESDGVTDTLRLTHCTPAGVCTATVDLASRPDPGFGASYSFLAVWIDPAAAGVSDTTRLGVVWGERPAAGLEMDLAFVELTSFDAAGVRPATVIATGLTGGMREADLVYEGGRWVAVWLDGTEADVAEIAPGGAILHEALPFGNARQGISVATNGGRVRMAAVYPDRIAIHRIGCR